MTHRWFPSMSDIPGVVWEPLVPVKEEKLRDRDAVMSLEERESFLDEGEIRIEERWSTPSGQELNGSPARRQYDLDEAQATAPTVARRVSEALMLPGTPSDYHFAIIGASGSLWSKRTSDPRVFGWVERLCLADIAMIESLGDVAEPITTERTAYDGTRFPAFPSYDQLSSMYVREGFLADAADIERRFGAVSGGERPAGQSVIARHQALLEEDGR